MQTKKYTSILLIVSSLVLLGAFQGFWLYKSYQEQRDLLAKQTDNLFQTTLSAQEDNFLSQSLSSSMFFQVPQKDFVKAANQSLSSTKLKTSTSNTIVGSSKDNLTNKSSETEPLQANNTKPKSKLKYKISIKEETKSDTMTTGENNPFKITNFSIATDNFNEAKKYSKLFIALLKQGDSTNKRDSIGQRKRPSFIFLGTPNDSLSLPTLSKDSILKILNLKKSMHVTADSLEFRPFIIQSSTPKKEKKYAQLPKKNEASVMISLRNDKGTGQGRSLSFTNTKSNEKIVISIELKTDSIQKAYQKSLDKVQIPLKFAIKTNPVKSTLTDDSLKTTIYKGNLSSKSYQAVFDNVRPYLFKKILPQSLFSLFLLGLVGLSFGLIYRSLQQQRRLTELKNDFISNITHELKTPITTVGVAIEALSSFNVLDNPAQTKEYLDISKSELNRLSLLVDRVLKMAVFEQSDPELHLETINLVEQVNTVMKSMKLQFEKYKAEVVFETQGQNFELYGDRIHITNVLYNLLDNALKYANGQPKIKIVLMANNNGLVLRVQDQGLGIAEAYQQKIFDKFFRVPTGNTHNVKGHGLGLSYVASVVKKHQGQINVESQVGHGTSFELVLPQKKSS